MIRNASILPINFYQIFISPFLKSILGTNAMCRYDETCSNYTKRMILQKGVAKGIGLGFLRILSCNPITH